MKAISKTLTCSVQCLLDIVPSTIYYLKENIQPVESAPAANEINHSNFNNSITNSRDDTQNLTITQTMIIKPNIDKLNTSRVNNAPSNLKKYKIEKVLRPYSSSRVRPNKSPNMISLFHTIKSVKKVGASTNDTNNSAIVNKTIGAKSRNNAQPKCQTINANNSSAKNLQNKRAKLDIERNVNALDSYNTKSYTSIRAYIPISDRSGARKIAFNKLNSSTSRSNKKFAKISEIYGNHDNRFNSTMQLREINQPSSKYTCDIDPKID
jgi:hypothetical protein